MDGGRRRRKGQHMTQIGEVVLDRHLGRPASIPEPGTWFQAQEADPDGDVWISLVDVEVEGPRAVDLAWERLRHLEHPAIPRVVAVDREAGALAVAAPWGVPLAALLEVRQEPEFVMTPATVLDVARQLSEALVHAHERGRPHGHLAPEQIWVTPDGQIVIWGFGVGPDAAPLPAWMAPERARGRRASGDADQWAMAAIVAGLVTGRVPWTSGNPEDAALGDTSHLVNPVMVQWAPLGRLVERALASEPKNRFPSIHPLRQAFAALEQRVRQESDLGRMATVLAERRGGRPIASEGSASQAHEPARSSTAPPASALYPAPVAEVAIIPDSQDDETQLMNAIRSPSVGARRVDRPAEAAQASPPVSPAVQARSAAGAASFSTPIPAPLAPGDVHARLDAAAELAAFDNLGQDPTEMGTRPTAVPGLLTDGTIWRDGPAPPGAAALSDAVPVSLAESPARERPVRPPGERLVVGPAPRLPSGPAPILVVAPWVVGGMVVLMLLWLWARG